MRWTLAVALILATTSLAGCVADQALDPLRETSSDDGTAPADDPPRRSTNDTVDGGPDEPAEPEAPDNGTADPPPEPEPDPKPPLAQNLSIADGEVLERTPTRTVLAWNGSTPTGVAGEAPPDGTANASTTFDVPPGDWVEVNATLTWDNPDADLSLSLADGRISWCDDGAVDPASDDASRSCEVRPHPRPGWERWSVRVDGVQRYDQAPGPVDFAVEVTIEAVDGPWASPPSRAPGNGWVAPAEAEVRPGVRIHGGGCTTNFLFTSPDSSRVYLGTAAHCVHGLGIGAPVTFAGIEDAGRVAYCSWGTMETGRVSACPPTGDLVASSERDNDLALVEVAPELRHLANPSVKGWGGPTGLAANATVGDNVLTYGNSTARDAGSDRAPDALDPREGYVCGVGTWMARVVLAGPSIPADSGSPVLDGSGRALGLMRSLGGDACPAGAENGVTKLAPALDFMRQSTGLEVQIETWSLQTEPRLPSSPVG